MQRADFIPQIAVNQINTADQTFFVRPETKQIVLLNGRFNFVQFFGRIGHQIDRHR